LAHTNNDKDESRAREKTNPLVAELLRRFKEKIGYTRCNDLLGVDRTTAEGIKKIRDENLPSKYCYCEGGFGQCAAEILESLLK
jgi:hypothetical protein